MIKEQEINTILKHFPNVELSYETNVHKKVYDADIIFAIPEGKKYFAWFTSHKNDNACFLMELADDKKIININICQTSFSDRLSYGTIFYGSMFRYDNVSCFSVEDILYHQGRRIDNLKTSFHDKFSMIHQILKKDMSQNVLHEQYVLFGLPVFVNGKNFSQLLNNIEVLPYKIKNIQFRYFHLSSGEKAKRIFNMNYFKPGSNYKQMNMNKNQLETAVFKVTADIQNDIYYLHTYKMANGNGISFEYFDIAFIPDYKTSVLMNRLFRKIKENDNLDALEESDDEDEFESDKLDKFVNLNKSYHMHCVYNYKFKKWVPASIAGKYEKVIMKKQIQQ
jgi:hypothetical protein